MFKTFYEAVKLLVKTANREYISVHIFSNVKVQIGFPMQLEYENFWADIEQ